MILIRIYVILVWLVSLGCTSPKNPEAEHRIAELEREKADLMQRVDALNKVLVECLGDSLGVAPYPSPPLIDAQVLAVKHDTKVVVLNKGKKDEVLVGYVFDVYVGSTYKGQVRIQEVQEDTSSGLIIREINPICQGDVATTNL